MPRDGSVEVSVSDTVVGIAPEDLEAVFEGFRVAEVGHFLFLCSTETLILCRK